jgi:pyruvate carboxylase
MAAGVPVIPATEVLGDDFAAIKAEAAKIGYPLMLKASWGGGGRGMRPILSEDEVETKVREGRREAEAAFGNGEGYLEKMILRARHVEVQILGDKQGNVWHLWERDCTVQRRNQKVVERAPAPYLTDAQREEVCEMARKICAHVNYECAGTVEFLMDMDTQAFYFIEVNPRVQVEHTVTEEVTGIDIVQAQILIEEGKTLAQATGVASSGRGQAERPRPAMPGHDRRPAEQLHPRLRPVDRLSQRHRQRHPAGWRHGLCGRRDHALLRQPAGQGDGARADAGKGDRADGPGLARVPHPRRGDEHRIRHQPAETPDLPERQLHHQVHRHDARAVRLQEAARPGDQDPDLHRRHHRQRPPRDGGPRPAPGRGARPQAAAPATEQPATGTRNLLEQKGPQAVADWMRQQKKVLITDTTMRDGHQSCWPRGCARST